MKSPMQKRIVQMEWTEQDFKDYYLNKYFRQMSVYILPILVVGLIAFFGFASYKNIIGENLSILAIAVCFIILFLIPYLKSRKAWDDIKDQVQPIWMKMTTTWGKDRK